MTMTIKPESGTGPSGNLKTSAINAANTAVTQEQADKNLASRRQGQAAKGSIIYSVVGYPVFNCVGPKRKPIRFLGGSYVLKATDPNFDAVKTVLDYHVEQDTLTAEEVK